MSVLPLLALVNTEALRSSDSVKGLRHDLSYELGWLSGDSVKHSFSGDYRLDYRHAGSEYLMILSRDYAKSNGLVSQDKGFVHLRRIKDLSSTLAYEGYIQDQFDRFINLKERLLYGLGLRFYLGKSTFKTFYLGCSLMNEHERYSNQADHEHLRLSNYVSFSYLLGSTFNYRHTTYYQVSTTDFQNYRLLSLQDLNLAFSPVISLFLKLELRYDNQPFARIERFNSVLKQGLRLRF